MNASIPLGRVGWHISKNPLTRWISSLILGCGGTQQPSPYSSEEHLINIRSATGRHGPRPSGRCNSGRRSTNNLSGLLDRVCPGSCVRLRSQYANHVWSCDFVHHRTEDGRAYRTLNIIDEFSRECLAIRVKRKLNSVDVIDALTDLFIIRGIPAYIRSDNGPEFIANAVRQWIKAVGAETAYIEPGSPWENGYCEIFNARFRDELLNGEIFYSLKEAQIVIEQWRRHYNTKWPHSALGYKPPATESIIPMEQKRMMH